MTKSYEAKGKAFDAIAKPQLVTKRGRAVKVGDLLKDFRGEKFRVVGWEAPRHSASTGRIHVRSNVAPRRGENFSDIQYFYPSVFDCKFV